MKRLIGAPFHSVSRAVDMLCLNLGPEVDWTSFRGEKRRMPAWSIHLQTPWRFVLEDKLLLASRDIYVPFAPEAVGEDWAYDPVGRPPEEGSLYDALVPEFSRRMAGSTVTSCRVSPLGDLKLDFSNGVRFRSFTPDSRKCEVWRLVDYLTGEHLAVFEEDEDGH